MAKITRGKGRTQKARPIKRASIKSVGAVRKSRVGMRKVGGGMGTAKRKIGGATTVGTKTAPRVNMPKAYPGRPADWLKAGFVWVEGRGWQPRSFKMTRK